MIKKYQIQPPVRPDPLPFEPEPECEHEYKPVKVVISNGLRVKKQCQLCGSTSGFVPNNSVSNPSALPDVDEKLLGLRSRRYEQRQADRTRRDAARAEAFNRLWWAWYADYLKSPIWAERRQLVLYRAGGICEACRAAPATEAHHLTYDNVGQEPLFDLVAVCQSCHQNITDRKREKK